MKADQAPPKAFRLLHISSPCDCDKELELLRDRYLDNALDDHERTLFEAHAIDCFACGVFVANWRTLQAASAYYSLPIGEALVSHLMVVPVVRPCAGPSDSNFKLILDAVDRELQ